MWILHFPAQLNNMKVLEELAALPEPDIEMFIACFTSARNGMNTFLAVTKNFQFPSFLDGF